MRNDFCSNYLAHHGILGQKWGVRRFQNPDGSLTAAGKERYREKALIGRRTARADITRRDVDSIVNSLSKEGKKNLEAEKGYLSFEQGQFVVKRILLKDGDKPVAFFDFIDRGQKNGKQNLSVALAVREEEQGKGYGSKVTKQGMDWINKHSDELGTIEWGTKKNNKASQSLAKKNGFIYDKKKSNKNWNMYRRP